MAIDFPNSPSNGQTTTVGSSTYTWNASTSTWDLTVSMALGPTGPTGAPGLFYESSTAPVSPLQGQAWYNTNDGTLYIYYGTVWVEATANLNGVGATGPTGPEAETFRSFLMMGA